jgi:mono/diheme cytochrome c family protein
VGNRTPSGYNHLNLCRTRLQPAGLLHPRFIAKESDVRLGATLIACVLALLVQVPWAGRAEDRPTVDFQRDILPLFKANCYQCHDGKKQKAGYRLDIRSRAQRGGESGKTSIVPGQPDKSDLIRRITSKDDEQVMPPSGKRLTPEQVKLLHDWVAAGAPWPDALANENDKTRHWAFQPPKRPELPTVKEEKWARNAIDRFVLARLEKEGIAPAAEAERITLIRRLTLDLIGLPPTVEEVDAFVNDTSPEAYDKVVTRLLASPHYGERWARPWLDAARYADSDGFEKDKSRTVYFYREWVINALNRDLPYDRFIIEQIAGDLLPNATQDQKVATGFLRNSMINEEGGVDPEQFRMEAMFDRMDAIGKGILGLTVQCAQCHNHKFDPLTQADYYRMFAFLNNDHEANIAVYTPAEQMKRAEIFRDIRAIENELRHKDPDWGKKLAEWEKRVQGDQPTWHIVKPELDASGGQKHYLLEDGSILAAGYAPTKHRTDFAAKTDLKSITAVRLELLNDPNLPLNGPGRSIQGVFGLTEFAVEAAPADAPGKKEKVKISRATADVNPPEKPLDAIFDDRSKRKRVTGPIQYAIDGKDETAWGIDIGPGRSNVPRKAVFLFEKPITFEKGAVVTIRLTQNHGGWNSDDNQNMNLGRFRFSVTDQANAEADPVPAHVRKIFAIPVDKRTPAQTLAIFSYWRTTVPEWKEANEKIESLWKQHPSGDAQLVLSVRDEPRKTHLLKRGDFLKPGQEVQAGAPSFLNAVPADAPKNRLAFANWLADRKSPTTARSFVNRVWQAYFGIGLVSTSEDLGTQCEAPSHAELLDWLAVEFMERGWKQKDLHRLIVTSATYRQSSKVTKSKVQDPYNRLLARGPRFRVDAESVRDIALATSGLLNPKVGGRSVFPPLPAFMLQPPVSYGPKIWPEDKGPERYRRAIYTFRYRSLPYPVLQTFDAPNGDASCVRRPRSNTPLQALMTLNEPVFLECSRALALKTIREGGKSDPDRLAYAFRRCVARKPSVEETQELLKLLEKQEKRFTQPGAKPWEVAADDPASPPKLPDGTTPSQLAAWTTVARVLLNLDETISKE